MPIYIHPANLIVPKSVIQYQFQGGISSFRDQYMTDQYPGNQEDEQLFSIAAWNASEFAIDKLTKNGLSFSETRIESDDFVILMRYIGKYWSCDWLEDNGLYAWHKDADPDKIKQAKDVALLQINLFEKMVKARQNPFKTIY